MQFCERELKRLEAAKAIVRKEAAHFGINKKREVLRLLYEISKRDHIHSKIIVPFTIPWDYKTIKAYLLQRRFPQALSDDVRLTPYLPSLHLKHAFCADLAPKKFYPQKIFIEKAMECSVLAQRFKKAFPRAQVNFINSLKTYQREHPFKEIIDYNQRRKNVFIVRQRYDFFKKCPCTKGARGCGYHIFNLGFGCIFECTYCYLQGYGNVSGIVLPANTEAYFEAFASYRKAGMRLGTGEFSDSLMMDDITEYSKPIIDFFRKYPEITFEFKTKSAHVKNLLETQHGGNIVVSWSVNPRKIVDENEFFCASLEDRLESAVQCVRAGYKIGFHFDPIICFPYWQKHYKHVVEMILSSIKPPHIAWISLGTLRFVRYLKPIIEARFPTNKILDGELSLSFDGKMRYSPVLRLGMYKYLIEIMRQFSKKLPIYLCMEESWMSKELKLKTF